MRWLAMASAVLGALAVACGGALVQTAMRGSAMWPPDRGDLWVAMWSARLLLPTLILAAAALLLGLVARRGPSVARIARVGRVLAVVGLLLTLWLPVQRVRRRDAESRPSTQCLAQVKNIAMGLEIYLSDYSRFPGQDRWCDTLDEYIKNRDVYRCPQAQARCGYAYNTALDSIWAIAVDPSRVTAVFDADGAWNAHGGKELLPDFPRHGGGDNYGFPDGHAAWFARKKPQGEVRWDTEWPREPDSTILRWGPKRKPQPP